MDVIEKQSVTTRSSNTSSQIHSGANIVNSCDEDNNFDINTRSQNKKRKLTKKKKENNINKTENVDDTIFLSKVNSKDDSGSSNISSNKLFPPKLTHSETFKKIKRLQEIIEAKVAGAKVVSGDEDVITIQFNIFADKCSLSVFTMEINIVENPPVIGTNNLPVFIPYTVSSNIKSCNFCETLDSIRKLLDAYMSRKHQVEELQKEYGKFITGRIETTLSFTYIEFSVQIKNESDGILTCSLQYDLFGTLPESIKGNWKAVKGSMEETEKYLKEELVMFLNKKLVVAFTQVFQCVHDDDS